MAVVGRANVFLGADTASFTSKMDKARRDMASSSVKMNRSLAKLDRGFVRVGKSAASFAKRAISIRGAIGLLAGTGGLALLVKRSLDAADSISKLSDATGIGTTKIQQLRFALDRSGVSVDTTDKALRKFVRNMGELGRSSSETQTALRDLDPVLLANFKSLGNVEDQLVLGFRALAGYKKQTKGAAVEAALFGRTGGAMTGAVKDGIVAFEGLQQRASDLGAVLGGKLLAGAVASKDELTDFGAVIEVNTTRIFLNFGPTIVALTAFFADLTSGIVNLVEETIVGTRTFLEFFKVLDSRRVKDIDGEIAALVVRINQLKEELETPLGSLTEGPAFDELEKLLDQLAVLKARLRAASKATDETAAATEDQTDATETQTRALEFQTDTVGDFIAGLRTQNRLMLLDADAREKIVAVSKAQDLAMAAGNLLRLDEVAAIRAAIDERQKLTEQIDAQAKAADDMQAALNTAARAAQDQADALARPCEEASPRTQARYGEQIQRIFQEAVS